MSLMQMIFVWSVGCAGLALVFSLILRHLLREKYALVWIFTCVSIITTPFFHPLYMRIMKYLGIVDSSSFYFFCGFIVLLLMAVQFSLALSTAWKQRKILTIQLALLEQRVRELEK